VTFPCNTSPRHYELEGHCHLTQILVIEDLHISHLCFESSSSKFHILRALLPHFPRHSLYKFSLFPFDTPNCVVSPNVAYAFSLTCPPFASCDYLKPFSVVLATFSPGLSPTNSSMWTRPSKIRHPPPPPSFDCFFKNPKLPSPLLPP